MFFFYSGSEPLSVLVPGEQYAVTVPVSDRSQKTTNEGLYNYIFSEAFEHHALFEKADSFEPPARKPAPQPPAQPKGKDKAVDAGADKEGGSE